MVEVDNLIFCLLPYSEVAKRQKVSVERTYCADKRNAKVHTHITISLIWWESGEAVALVLFS